jgi:hypothetical protein
MEPGVRSLVGVATLHPDGLLNRHIKFRDGTEVELMTVSGAPRSRMARDYASLLAAGEGGVYAALWTNDMAASRLPGHRAQRVQIRNPMAGS